MRWTIADPSTVETIYMIRLHPVRSSVGAFTLIELLVVLSIISVLVALLLPALSKARESSRSLQCQANQRQVAAAMMMYSDSYDGQLLPNQLGPPLYYWQQGLQYFLDGRVFLDVFPRGQRPRGMWACPASQMVTAETGPIIHAGDFGKNHFIAGNDSRDIQHLSDLTRPSIIMNTADSDNKDMHGTVLAPNHVWGMLPRHDGARLVNRTFWDGHVSTDAIEDIPLDHQQPPWQE